MFSRRAFTAGLALSAAAATRLRLPVSILSAITDEIGVSPSDAIAFARQYGLSWVELRSVPGGGGEYAFLPVTEIRNAAARLSDSGLRVSFLNTGMLKFGLPGTEPVRRRAESGQARTERAAREAQRFARRLEDLKRASKQLTC